LNINLKINLGVQMMTINAVPKAKPSDVSVEKLQATTLGKKTLEVLEGYNRRISRL
jgi:hypothetical protein